jgi:hypothetical protein
VKVLVTGCTSRQANPEASKKDVTFAYLLATALRGAGHEVEHRNPDITEDLSDFDHVFLGLAPLHGLGSNRSYGAVAVALRTMSQGNLTLYIDDPDIGKVVSGLRTMVNEPKRFTKPFFAYKLQHDIASQPEYASWLSAGVKMLHENAWPSLLVPFHLWATASTAYERKVPQAAGRIWQLDLSNFMPKFDIQPAAERERRWIVEARDDNKWLSQQRPEMPMTRYGKGAQKRPHDMQLYKEYCNSWGVLQPPVDPVGWWDSRITYAARAGAVYLSRWQDLSPLGTVYTDYLPDRVAAMSTEERDDLAARQAEALAAQMPSDESNFDVLNDVMSKQGASV